MAPNGIVTEPSVDKPFPINYGANFVWTNADPTEWWWNQTQRVNPMSCRPCSGFFPEPGIGSMSLLPAEKTTPTAVASSSLSSGSSPVIAGIVAGVVVLISIIGAFVFFALRRRHNSKMEMMDKNINDGGAKTAGKGGIIGNGVDASKTTVYVPLDGEEQEIDLFAIKAARGVGAPPSYDHVATVLQRSIASEHLAWQHRGL
ncbi:hypothetical protein HDU76_006506, partial [Blyttiomyces sp. JEL0837]